MYLIKCSMESSREVLNFSSDCNHESNLGSIEESTDSFLKRTQEFTFEFT